MKKSIPPDFALCKPSLYGLRRKEPQPAKYFLLVEADPDFDPLIQRRKKIHYTQMLIMSLTGPLCGWSFSYDNKIKRFSPRVPGPKSRSKPKVLPDNFISLSSMKRDVICVGKNIFLIPELFRKMEVMRDIVVSRMELDSPYWHLFQEVAILSKFDPLVVEYFSKCYEDIDNKKDLC